MYHPKADYFRISHIGEDQLALYAQRKKQTKEETKKWLSSLLP
jgi:hypothetical protein